jgi:2-polyprenyl-3-methyl-5-hydroxy-6-metoxy-1,4-benzoquinol methylase
MSRLETPGQGSGLFPIGHQAISSPLALLARLGHLDGDKPVKPPEFDPCWDAEIKALYAHDMQEMWDPSIAPHVWNQYHNQLDLYFGFTGSAPTDVLDIGCAQATLSLLLAEKGHRVCAVDIRPHFLEYARSRYTHGEIDFVCGDASKLQLGRAFDLIFANQILEHVVYPERVLVTLASHLRPGGRLIATTPSWHYLMNRLPSLTMLGERSQWECRENTADGDGHFFAYKVNELAEVFRQAGLRQVRVGLFETPLVSGHMKVRHTHRVVPASVLRTLDRALLYLPVIRRGLAHQLIAHGTM